MSSDTRTQGETRTDTNRSRDELAVSTIALMVAGMAVFGSATPVSQIVGRSFPVWLGSAARMAIAAAVLAPVVVVRRRRRDEPPLVRVVADSSPADKVRLAAVGVVGTFAFSALMLAGMRETTGAIAAVVMATTPAVTGIASVVFLGERATPAKAMAIALAVAGVVVVNVFGAVGDSEGDRIVLGALLVFGAVCCEATYTLVGRSLSSDLDPMSLTLTAAVVALVAMAPLAVWDLVGFAWSAPTAGQWIGVVWWGAGTMAIGSVLWFFGVRRVAGTTASAFMAVMPISALVLSYVLLDDAFRWMHLVGMGLVLVGLALIVRESGQEDNA